LADIGRIVVVALPVTSCAAAEAVKPHASARLAMMRKGLMELDAMISSYRIIVSLCYRAKPAARCSAERRADKPQLGYPRN
jgi:hypothetical protein